MRLSSVDTLLTPLGHGDGYDQSVLSGSGAGGTGSWPPGWKGWHLPIRLIASHTPRRPWVSIASAAYTEHVGSKRHAGGRNGEMNRL